MPHPKHLRKQKGVNSGNAPGLFEAIRYGTPVKLPEPLSTTLQVKDIDPEKVDTSGLSVNCDGEGEGKGEEPGKYWRVISTDDLNYAGSKKMLERWEGLLPRYKNPDSPNLERAEELRKRALRFRAKYEEYWKDTENRFKVIQSEESLRECRSAKELGKSMYECKINGCPWIFTVKEPARRHLLTHYPEALFCPICLRVFINKYLLDKHFKEGGSSCAASSLLIYYKSQLTVRYGRMDYDVRFFNLYFLGIAEDIEMPDEHFEYIAHRKRHEALDI